MEAYQIRAVEREDLPACVQVIREGFGTVAKEFGLTEENCPTNGAFMTLARLRQDYDQGNLMYALFVGEEMAGFAQLAKTGHRVFELEKLVVLPQYRHGGFGGVLLAHARAHAKALGAKKLTIGIIEENRTLKRWYLQHGFVEKGTKRFASLPFTVGFMELKI